ncbi:hypothetical protein ABID21_005020 [Pseudorhizobium tarimense]|uniref:Uncharacterized protein n=1 Tax=Pseudorhizobium tarimense TaxID=1079109 RepID=A0ABV2HEA8_9HYPH
MPTGRFDMFGNQAAGVEDANMAGTESDLHTLAN